MVDRVGLMRISAPVGMAVISITPWSWHPSVHIRICSLLSEEHGKTVAETGLASIRTSRIKRREERITGYFGAWVLLFSFLSMKKNEITKNSKKKGRVIIQ